MRYLFIFVAMAVSCKEGTLPFDTLPSCNDCFNTDYCVPTEFGDETPLQFDLTQLNDINLIDGGDFASSSGWTLGAYWTITGGKLVFAGLGGAANSASKELNLVLTPSYYKISFVLENASIVNTGSFAVTLAGFSSATFDIVDLQPGTRTINLYLYPNSIVNNTIAFTGSSGDFTIDNLEITQMSEVGFEIKDCDADTVFYTQTDSSDVEYLETTSVILTGSNNPTSSIVPVGTVTLDWDTYGLSEGCYCVCIIDAADANFNYVPNGVFDTSDFWTFDNVGASGWSVASNKLNKAKDATVGTDKADTELVTQLDADSCYKLTFDTDSDNGSEVEVRYSDSLVTDGLLDTITIPIGGGSVEIDITGKDMSKLAFWAASDDEEFNIDNVVLTKTTDCVDCLCTSICVSLTTDYDTRFLQGCNLLLTATCDNNAFGFNFTDVSFTHKLRVNGRLRNESFETDAEYYVKSNGEKILVYAEKQENVELIIAEIPAYMHKVVNMMLLCDTFTIDGIEYVRAGDYSPNWRKSSMKAPVIVLVSKASQDRFNTFG